jgi:putative ABC transport system permease protein
VISIAGWVIGGFSILVGGFGIANIMSSVRERTNIIGIQKSCGAKLLYIIPVSFESVCLSLMVGGMEFSLHSLLSLSQPSTTWISKISFSNIMLGLGVSTHHWSCFWNSPSTWKPEWILWEATVNNLNKVFL